MRHYQHMIKNCDRGGSLNRLKHKLSHLNQGSKDPVLVPWANRGKGEMRHNDLLKQVVKLGSGCWSSTSFWNPGMERT